MKTPQFSYIYGLKDSTDGQIHYIGKSNSPSQRLQEHVENTTTNAARVEWIDGLLKIGLSPELVILEKVLRSEWRESEIYWIARGHEEGWPLTNIRAGGGGGESGPRKMPNYDFMRGFVGDDLWDKFDSMTILEKDGICLQTAQEAIGLVGIWAPFELVQAITRGILHAGCR